MTKIYICDGEKKWQEKVSAMLTDFSEKQHAPVKISCFDSIDKALKSEEPAPDVMFTEVEFDGEEKGIDMVGEVNRVYPECNVVYMTDNVRYALDVYDTRHIWFALKEQLGERIPEIYRKVCLLDEERRSYLVIRTTDGTTVRIPCRDIMYIERKDRKTIIVTYERRYEVKERIPFVLEKLPSDRFARCHNSFAVNLDKVGEIHSGSLRMRNGTEIVISRGYNKSFRAEYMNRVNSRAVTPRTAK